MLLFIFFFLQILPNENLKTVFIKESISSSEIGIGSNSPFGGKGAVIYIAPYVTLTIDNTFTLTNCEVVLGADATIEVENGDTLNILNSHIHACDTMWQGIYVNYGSTIVIDSSKMEDAMNGVVMLGNGSKMLVRNTAFNRNYKGVTFYTYSPADTAYDISGCYFGMGSYTAMLPAPAGYANYAKPLCGIDIIYSAGVSIPNPALNGQPNTFEKMNYGIKTEGSFVSVLENTFDNIRDYDALLYGGSAIYGVGYPVLGSYAAGSLSVQTSDTLPAAATPARFTDCDYGVVTYALKVNATRNRMNNVKHGVKTMNGLVRVYASDNYMTNTNYGITLNNNAAAEQRVWNNTVTVNPPTTQFVFTDSGIAVLPLNTYGIFETEINSNVAVNSNIDSNHIFGGRNCIALNNTNGANVFDNQLHQHGTTAVLYTQAGIYASNCDSLRISGNFVQGNGMSYCDATDIGVSCNVSSAYRKIGYSFYRSTGEICDNATDSIGYGMYFASECYGTSVRYNAYNRSKFGIVLRSSGSASILQSQGYDSTAAPFFLNKTQRHENQFIGDGTSNHVFANDSNFRTYSFINTNSFYDPPKFYYSGSNLPSNVELSDTSGATLNGVYQPLAAIQAISVNPSLAIPYECAVVANPVITPWDSLVAGGGAGTHMEEGFSDVGAWLSERALYNKLRANTALLSADTVLSNFYETKTGGTLKQIWDYEQKLKELNDSATVADTALYKQALHEADSLNKLIAYTNTPEQAYVAVNTIYLAKQKDTTGNFTPTQLSTLKTLAAQCPYVAGDAVYIARALLARVEDVWFYDDVALCAPPEESGKWEGEAKGNTEQDALPLLREFVKVYPNPAATQLNVLFKANVRGNAKFEMLNTMGQTVKTFYVSEGTNYLNFDVSDLADGLYLWRLRDNARAIGSGTVAIQR